ncbi:MAG: hypothetical protein HY554_10840 [Elusimicrobia bacterium]|nr:hypothetical protein [Elusimicrobiota bacterium]
MREADRLGARFAVIFGEAELREGKCTVKDMSAKDRQWQASPSEVPGQLAERLRAAP